MGGGTDSDGEALALRRHAEGAVAEVGGDGVVPRG